MVYFVNSIALCEQPLGGSSFAVNSGILYSVEGQGERQERRKSIFCTGGHSVHFPLGCSVCAQPLGNDAVS